MPRAAPILSCDIRVESSPALKAGVAGWPGSSGGLASEDCAAFAAWRKGRNSSIGTGKIVVELFSESLGEEGSGAETYLQLIRTNADRIVEALT